MDTNKVDYYIVTNQKYFPPEQIPYIRGRLEQMDEAKFMAVSCLQLKDPTVMLLLSVFVGYLGIDRFLIGDIGMGVLKLLTGGLCGVLTIVDWFLISDKTRNVNFNTLMTIL